MEPTKKLTGVAALTSVSSTLAAVSTLEFAGKYTPWLIGAASIVITVAVFLVSPSIAETADEFRGKPGRAISMVQRWSTAAAAIYSAWVVLFVSTAYTIVMLIVCVVVLGALSVGVYYVACVVAWKIDRIERVITKEAKSKAQQLPTDPKQRKMHEAMREAGFGYMRQQTYARLDNDAGYEFLMQMPSWKQQSAEVDKDGRKVEVLPPSANEAIAIGLSEVFGRNIPATRVHIRKEIEKGAGIYSVTVLEYDVFGEVIPYIDDPTPATIDEEKVVGYDSGGKAHTERIDVHSRNIGATRSGKSSEINVEIAEITKCRDAIMWIGGCEKLWDQVGPWVRPYVNTQHRLPLDWISNGAEDTLNMMASAMRVARYRQTLDDDERDYHTLIVLVDEFSFLAKQSRVTVEFDGQPVNATQLAAMLINGAASASVIFKVASQRDITSHYGDEGGDLINGVKTNMAFRGNDPNAIGRITGDYKLPSPRNKGEFWISSEKGVYHLKSGFIARSDKDRAATGAKCTVEEVSWARRHMDRPTLGISEALAAGDAYTHRHTEVDDAMIGYLKNRDVGSTTKTHTTSLRQQAHDEAITQLRKLKAAAGLDTPEPEPTIETPPSSRRAAIQRILDETATAMSTTDIVSRLVENGDTNANARTVGTELGRMNAKGTIEKVGEGTYASSAVTFNTHVQH